MEAATEEMTDLRELGWRVRVDAHDDERPIACVVAAVATEAVRWSKSRLCNMTSLSVCAARGKSKGEGTILTTWRKLFAGKDVDRCRVRLRERNFEQDFGIEGQIDQCGNLHVSFEDLMVRKRQPNPH